MLSMEIIFFFGRDRNVVRGSLRSRAKCTLAPKAGAAANAGNAFPISGVRNETEWKNNKKPTSEKITRRSGTYRHAKILSEKTMKTIAHNRTHDAPNFRHAYTCVYLGLHEIAPCRKRFAQSFRRISNGTRLVSFSKLDRSTQV